DVASAVREPAGGAPTGLILFEARLPSVTRVQYHRSGSAGAALAAGDVADAVPEGTRLVHLTGITPALGPGPRAAVDAAVARARAVGAVLSFDVNHRARLWTAEDASPVLSQLARAADIVIGSADELTLVGGIDALLAGGVREVVTKLGADGAAARSAGKQASAPGHRVTVVDTIGAGDAFTAGYLSAALDGLDLPGRLARGNACGAFAVAGEGDWEGLPTRDELSLLDVPDGEAVR